MYAVNNNSNQAYKIKEMIGGKVILVNVASGYERVVDFHLYQSDFRLVDEENIELLGSDLDEEILKESRSNNIRDTTKGNARSSTTVKVSSNSVRKRKTKRKIRVSSKKHNELEKPKGNVSTGRTKSKTSKTSKGDGEYISLAELCKKFNIEPKKARQKLRGKVSKPGGKWEWPIDHKDIKKVEVIIND